MACRLRESRSARSSGEAPAVDPVVSAVPTVMFTSPVGPTTHVTSPVTGRGRPSMTIFGALPAAGVGSGEEQFAADVTTTQPAATRPIRRTSR